MGSTGKELSSDCRIYVNADEEAGLIRVRPRAVRRAIATTNRTVHVARINDAIGVATLCDRDAQQHNDGDPACEEKQKAKHIGALAFGHKPAKAET